MTAGVHPTISDNAVPPTDSCRAVGQSGMEPADLHRHPLGDGAPGVWAVACGPTLDESELGDPGAEHS